MQDLDDYFSLVALVPMDDSRLGTLDGVRVTIVPEGYPIRVLDSEECGVLRSRIRHANARLISRIPIYEQRTGLRQIALVPMDDSRLGPLEGVRVTIVPEGFPVRVLDSEECG
ncbi:uncharacterized protein LOC113463943, partial [Ceratina calcarata]|uniref:Uncharacterized protein LOC113463943 n=1 Tax=Ceratina calcarata TaxID=156304 RepID=A0AAJ7RWG6_9HYME